MSYVAHHKSVSARAVDQAPDVTIPASKITPSRYFRWSGALNRVLGILLLAPGLPIIFLLVVIVRCGSRGPGIYRQVRVGRDGKTFEMFKIRTMRNDAEAVHGPEWTSRDDPRITRVGRYLRKLHLDEFPQLFNVVRGDMALIGPRPERPEFIQVLAREIPGYLDRLTVLPGITGLAQINLPPDTDLDSVRRKLVLDLEYVREASFLLDLRMFVCTLLRLMGLKGEMAMKLICLQRDVPVIETKAPSAPNKANGRRTPMTIVAERSRSSSNDRPSSILSPVAVNGAAGARLPEDRCAEPSGG